MTDWSTDWLVDWLIDWVIDWLIYLLIDWLVGWLIDWLVDWLIDWVTACVENHCDSTCTKAEQSDTNLSSVNCLADASTKCSSHPDEDLSIRTVETSAKLFSEFSLVTDNLFHLCKSKLSSHWKYIGNIISLDLPDSICCVVSD